MQSSILKILENAEIQEGVFQLKVPYNGTVTPGQFIMISSHQDQLLGRAISVCDVTEDALLLVYQVVGKETAALSRCSVGDDLRITGPVGQGFTVNKYPKGSRVALVGGGVGTAPLVYTGKKLAQQGVEVDAYLGFRSRSMLKEELESCCATVSIATEDGSEGEKGFVTSIFQPTAYDAVFCCGPTPMMKAVVEQCESEGVPVFVSLENKMACGIGACMVCTCTKKDGTNHATCITGPVYPGEELDFHA